MNHARKRKATPGSKKEDKVKIEMEDERNWNVRRWAWRAKLWDVFDKDHHSRRKREIAYKELAAILKFSKNDIKSKIAGLRTHVGCEVAKVKALLNQMLMCWNRLPLPAFKIVQHRSTGFNKIERMLKQMLKPFALAFSQLAVPWALRQTERVIQS